MHNREIKSIIQRTSTKKTGRLIVLTGARQTGKTTLAKTIFKDFEYLSIEDPILRTQFASLSASQWKDLFPKAILDEVQKEPILIESIKSVYDQWDFPSYILLGSSQLLLLQKVKESLAGRVSIFEIFPLTFPELATKNWEDAVKKSIFIEMMIQGEIPEFLPSFLLDKSISSKLNAWEHYNKFGAYPALSDEQLDEDDKFRWLSNYVKTYLERDIRDLANFRDLEPVIKLQKLLASHTANLLNISEIAKRLGLNNKTVQKYIQYFEISYQIILLPAWHSNLNKRLSKMPKIHLMDFGILQSILQKKGGMTGNEFESAIITEMYKQLKNNEIKAEMFHLRTHDGKEVDLIIEFENYYLAFEIKQTDKISISDARHLRDLQDILDKPLKKAFILSADQQTKYFYNNSIIAVNFAMFLG
jgi:predicted AAA+ superfamily ATPase